MSDSLGEEARQEIMINNALREQFGDECRYCGEDGFDWTQTEKGWRLVSRKDNAVHWCDKYPPIKELKKSEDRR